METKERYLVFVRLDSDPGDSRGHAVAVCGEEWLANEEADWMRSSDGGWDHAWVENIDFIADEEDLTTNG